MRIKQLLPNIPAQSLWYILLCSTGILLFILIGLYPLQTSLNRLDESLAETRVRIEEQKTLFPLYKELMGRALKTETKTLLLPDSVRSGISVDQIADVSLLLQKMVQECDLQPISCAPDAKSLTSNSNSMSVHLTARGDFLRLRKLLVKLETLPWLERIQEMQILEAPAGREFRIKFWVAVSREKSRYR
jgi:hypothetical protein